LIGSVVKSLWGLYKDDLRCMDAARHKALVALQKQGKMIPPELADAVSADEIDSGLRAFFDVETQMRERREARLHKQF